MVVQWALGQNLISYDSVNKEVRVVDQFGVEVEPLRPATTEEIRYYEETFGGPGSYNEVVSRLTSALTFLRSATEDQQVTNEEIAAAMPVVMEALYLFRDVSFNDPEILRLVILILSQINLVLFTLISSSGPRFQALFSQSEGIQYRLDDIEARLFSLEVA